MKRLIALLLALIMLLTLLPQITPSANAYVVQSGYCGENLSYVLNYTTLTISGEGPMYNYSRDNPAPWDSFALDITHIFIEDGVTTIGDYAFGNTYYYVQEIQIPDSVTYIGEHALAHFRYLGSSSFTVPAGVQSVGPNFLSTWPYLENIYVDEDNPYLCSIDGVLYSKDVTTLYMCPRTKTSVTIPDTVTTIAPSAFERCQELSFINLPDSVTEIGDSAFAYCTKLTSIRIPEGVTRIEDGTLRGCYSLANISLHDNITYIGNMAFHDTAITNMTLPESLTELGPAVFSWCANLTTLYIPSSIESIGTKLLDYCTAFTDAFYEGSEADWNKVSVDEDNETLLEHLRFGVSAPAAGNLLLKSGEFQYNNTFTDTTWTFPYSYDESWFFNLNNFYQHDLCRMSLRVALAAFGDTDKGSGPANIMALMDDLGFTYTEESVSYPTPDFDSMGYAIGSKTLVNSDGETCSLILVAVRGGAYGAEWGGNFLLGMGEDHEGFSSGSFTVLDGLERYLEAHEDELEDTVKVWIVGYSRGAAVANLTAARLNDGYGEICPKFIDRDNVYAYCFECPQNTADEDAHDGQYSNIISIVNPIDLVPKVAMSDWGFDRYGQVFRLPGVEYTATYKDRKAKMIDCYEDILDENDYTLGMTEIPYAETRYQASALDTFTSNICETAGSRENYYRTMESDVVREISTKMAGSWNLNWFAVIETLIELVGITDYPINTLYVVNLAKNGTLGNAHYPELCLAWLDSLEQSWFYGFGKIDDAIAYMDDAYRRKYLINCPVDVEVYDANGDLVVQIINDEVQDIEGGLAAYIDDDGQKVVVLPGDGEYDVKLIATDDGTMSCTVEEFASNDTMSRTVAYYDIEITENDVLYSEADAVVEDTTTDYPLILPNGTEAQTSIDKAPVSHSISVTTVGHGTAFAPATKTEGEYAALRATPDENESFLGWYNGETLVSSDAEYRFRVEQDISLTAKFSANHHTWDEGEVTQEPTATTEGNRLHTCTHENCDATWNEALPALGPGFTDIAPGAFYYDAVGWAVRNNVTKGTSATTFSPNNNCTRGEVVTFLWRAMGSPTPQTTDCKFTDVKPGTFYYNAMLWAVEQNITNGTSATTFSPDGSCTRGQVVTFLYRSAK